MRLDLERLSVESYAVTGPEGDRGTVAAHESDGDTQIGPSCRRCPSEACPTQVLTCAPSCGYCTDYVPSCAIC
jgi:ribosomal protein L37E